MIMDSEDEKFFENLVGAKTEADSEYEMPASQAAKLKLSW